MVFSVPTKTHGYTVPLTVTGAVFTGTGRGIRKYTWGLPVSCLTHPGHPMPYWTQKKHAIRRRFRIAATYRVHSIHFHRYGPQNVFRDSRFHGKVPKHRKFAYFDSKFTEPLVSSFYKTKDNVESPPAPTTIITNPEPRPMTALFTQKHQKSKIHPFPPKKPHFHPFQHVSAGQTKPPNSLQYPQTLRNSFKTFPTSAPQVTQKIHFHLSNVTTGNSTKTDFILLNLHLNIIVTIFFRALIFNLKTPIIIHNRISQLLWIGIKTHVLPTSAMLYVLLVGFVGNVSFYCFYLHFILCFIQKKNKKNRLVITLFFYILFGYYFHGLSFLGRRGCCHVRGGHME
jgi:hypothetical protein